ncbi:hypothetical protein D9613_011107 [Agrocybe pediades]|uniref:Conidiation-specific protein 6 n=1 Tax=Agrocybe pediades TaxID=84607 RepID=A0A8H4QM09_9AGAR|nr:hypothetical protein D9613_011107 [Agrocybe pediades]
MSSNEGNVARGLKATIHNPNTSAEAKESAVNRLQDMGYDAPEQGNVPNNENVGRQSGGSGTSAGRSRITKATGAGDDDGDIDDLMNDIGDVVDENYTNDITAGEPNRVLGGYKATLKNPRVSDEAKQHAQEVLDAADANN